MLTQAIHLRKRQKRVLIAPGNDAGNNFSPDAFVLRHFPAVIVSFDEPEKLLQ
jgi:hypothetical protein